jgi:hypothetical protein
VAVAAGGRRCRDARAAAGDERGDRGPDEHRGRDRDRDPAPREAHPPLLRAVDEPQQRGDARVDEQHAADRGQQAEERRWAGDDQRAGGDQRERAQHAQGGARGLGRGEPPEPSQRGLDPDRREQRRRGGRHDGADGGERPARGAQVGQEGVPDPGRRVAVALLRDLPQDGPARDGVADHDHDPHRGRSRAQPRHGAAAVRREPDARHRQRDRQQREDRREPLDALRQPDQPRGTAVDLLARQRDPRVLADPGGQRGLERLDGGFHDRPGVGDGERDGVEVAIEHGAVHVEHSGAEQLPERRAADDAPGGLLDQGARGLQVGGVREHDAVGQLGSHARSHPVVLQRRGRAVGELLRREERPVGIPGHDREEQREERRGQADGGEPVP